MHGYEAGEGYFRTDVESGQSPLEGMVKER